RAFHVTGVQTCALPICARIGLGGRWRVISRRFLYDWFWRCLDRRFQPRVDGRAGVDAPVLAADHIGPFRATCGHYAGIRDLRRSSEERRAGQEGGTWR